MQKSPFFAKRASEFWVYDGIWLNRTLISGFCRLRAFGSRLRNKFGYIRSEYKQNAKKPVFCKTGFGVFGL